MMALVTRWYYFIIGRGAMQMVGAQFLTRRDLKKPSLTFRGICGIQCHTEF
jgi:hypothetical protein